MANHSSLAKRRVIRSGLSTPSPSKRPTRMRRPLARADDTDRISWLRARQLLDHALAGPLPLFQEHQEIGHLLPVRPLVELLDDVGADLAGGGQDPKEIPTRRRSETVSEASRILPKHRGASVSAPGAQSSNDGHADDTGGDATGTHMAEGGSTLLHALMFPESAADRIAAMGVPLQPQGLPNSLSTPSGTRHSGRCSSACCRSRRMTARRSPPDRSKANERQRMKYAKEATSYDKGSDFDERWLYGTEHRTWACSRAIGTTLEVPIGTGRNLPLYPPHVRLVGLDLTPEMLSLARSRAADLAVPVTLCECAAQALPFSDGVRYRVVYLLDVHRARRASRSSRDETCDQARWATDSGRPRAQ